MRSMKSSKKDLLAREIRARCRGELRVDEPLSGHTTFGMGGPADLFFLPADLDDLGRAVPLVRDSGLPVLPLGGGTNMLVREAGFRGLVLCLTSGLTRTRVEADLGQAQAGASLQVFSRRCQRAGRTGMEFGCGIPGTVGGAIRGNAGAWGGETVERLIWLQGIDLRSGEMLRLGQDEVSFGYRHTDLPAGLVVVDAAFHLAEENPEVVKRRMDEMLARRKASQPLWKRNAGCVFKNPPGRSAGLLIDQAGCKRLSAGAVEVSDLHANFMTNTGGGTAEEALALIEQVRERVRRTHGVELETEVRIVGTHGVENP